MRDLALQQEIQERHAVARRRADQEGLPPISVLEQRKERALIAARRRFDREMSA